jgi:translocation and assembly module TamA
LLRLSLARAAAVAVLTLLSASPALADVPKARIEGVADRDLRERLEAVVGVSPERPASRFEARRRARQALEAVTAALRSEGYYGAVIEADVGEGDAPEAVLRVTTGERFLFTQPKLDWEGPPPSQGAREAALEAAGLEPGAPGRSEDVVEAEGRAVAALSQQGYADARIAPREVVVDHATRTVNPTYRIAAGPLVQLDGLQLESTGRTRRDWILSLAPWREGDVYDPDDVAELERRLLDTGVYDSVTVALAPPARATAEGLRPVVVSLADRPRRTIELGAGYSTSEGVGLEGEFNRFNQFGRGDTLTARSVLAQIERRIEAELSLPHFRRSNRTLRVGAEAFQSETNAYDEVGVGVRADLTQRWGRTTFLTYGLRGDLSQTVEQGMNRDFIALTGLLGFALDRSNDILNPTSGWRVEGRVEPTTLTGDASLVFIRNTAQATAYFPFDEEGRTSLAGRARLGVIAGGEIPAVPAGRRFYAGGGGSVRGYEYQSIGPRLQDNTPQGGLSLLETSLELRRNGFGDRGIWRALGGVAFIDAGAVGSKEYPDPDELKIGVGFGVRFDLGFAPVRADIAFPLQKEDGESPFQIYIGLGQAF